MKRLMISIHPEWVQKILNGEKTIEVRPWRIKEEDLPCEVYIYCTIGEQLERHWTKVLPLSEQFILYGNKVKKDRLSSPHCLNGKVVAKFILNKVESFNPKLGNPKLYVNACVSDTELMDIYPNKTTLYALHIENLVIFDKPKELGEFYKAYPWFDRSMIKYIEWYKHNKQLENYRRFVVTKAPQKMVWVEEGKE